jgi:hypothetical protein
VLSRGSDPNVAAVLLRSNGTTLASSREQFAVALSSPRHGQATLRWQPFAWHSTKEAAMKETLAVVMVVALAACGDKPKLAPVAQAAVPKAVAAPAKTDPDQELASRVARAFEAAKLQGIDAVAAGGVVTLWGAVPSARERSRAAQVAARVEGVKAVDNRLEVVTGS